MLKINTLPSASGTKITVVRPDPRRRVPYCAIVAFSQGHHDNAVAAIRACWGRWFCSAYPFCFLSYLALSACCLVPRLCLCLCPRHHGHYDVPSGMIRLVVSTHHDCRCRCHTAAAAAASLARAAITLLLLRCRRLLLLLPAFCVRRRLPRRRSSLSLLLLLLSLSPLLLLLLLSDGSLLSFDQRPV